MSRIESQPKAGLRVGLARFRSLVRSIGLPGRLMLIASAALLPLALVCAFALQGVLRGQHEQTEASTLGLARALATSIDSELRLAVSALETLALAGPLGLAGDTELEQAKALTGAVLASHPEWRSVLLATPSGEVVFRSGSMPRSPDAAVVEKASLVEVLRIRAPVVGPMSRGPEGRLAFPVRVPVIRDGAVRYVLTAIVRPEAIAEVLVRQRIPEGWNASVFDSNDARVARTLDDERLRGKPPSDSLQALMRTMDGRQELVGTTHNVDGVKVQTAVVRVHQARWTVALGASVAAAESAQRRILLAYGGGLLVSLCLGALAAWWMSRAITGPMTTLRRLAGALGSGLPVRSAASGITEIDAVADALVLAAAQRDRSIAEREALLAAERSARTIAEAAERRLERLVGAGSVLSRSLEEASTLAAIAEVIVPGVADVCRIDLLDDAGALHRKLTHHFDPACSARMAAAVDARTAPSDAPGSFPWAIATGETFLQNLDDPELPRLGDPGLRDFIETFGITAGCVVPLVARGRTIGAMAVLQAGSGRRFSAEDGALIGELAKRAALALDNVRLLAHARVAQVHAEEANRAKDEFLAMLGHELRNPLAPIALALQLMARRDPQALPRERQIIERQVKHLSRMVDDLLDVSRIVAGKITLKTEIVDLRDVAARALELTLPALEQRSAMPAVSMPEVPVLVLGDPVRLAQIVSNLLNNAAKFTATEGRIRLALQAGTDEAELTVSDDGIGISAELLPHVFERFVQGAQALQRASGGLGLGLAIARSLVKLHGGSIQAFSEGAGKGSSFTVRLPLVAGNGLDIAHPGAAATAERKLRMLLVDDNHDAVDSLAEWFELEGHAVRTANSAEEALERLSESPSDAAVFDIGLPGMSGYELARRVRDDPTTRSMALVALTGYGTEADREQALAAGFDDHFAKPAPVELMLERLQQLVALRQSLQYTLPAERSRSI